MSDIKLSWPEKPGEYDEILIYRSDHFIDRDALPVEPYVKLLPGIGEYVDVDVFLNRMYYYMVLGRKGDFIGGGTCTGMACIPNTGPGPQELIRGDYHRGVFGTMMLSEITAVGDIAQVTGAPVSPDRQLLKVVVRGRIFFLPLNTLWALSIETAYRLGMAYPTNDPATFHPTLTQYHGVVPQQKVFVLGENEYRFSIAHGNADTSVSAGSLEFGGTLGELYLPFMNLTSDNGFGRLEMAPGSGNFTTLDLSNHVARYGFSISLPGGTTTNSNPTNGNYNPMFIIELVP
mgnify:CR=1 FL=1